MNPLFYTDFYKTDHRNQYPQGTEKVYSNFTARISRIKGWDHTVVFGVQQFVIWLNATFSKDFFSEKLETVVGQYKRLLDNTLGKDAVTMEHIIALHRLGYLPLEIKALPEGTVAPLKVPILTITNTHKDFAWLPNFLETLLSNSLWHPITSATIAYNYRKLLEQFANETSDIKDLVKFQGHDFSMRGQASLEASILSGGGHLLSFVGTDTIPAIKNLEYYYGADVEKELVGCSVPATEHSVMCLNGKETERETYKRLITEVYPKGIVSIVSDTWDYFGVLTKTIPSLKEEIMARDGKVVIRPDSGSPVKILCGDPTAPVGSPEHKGSIEILWEHFGGTTNSKGYKQLDSHIGLIYGDSITFEIAQQILEGFKAKGFASTNIVFGIGSYTYQYVTRDTFGFAMKATYGIVNGEPLEIFKDPITDGGVKKSAKGLLQVYEYDGQIFLRECCTPEEEKAGLLKTVFLNGAILNRTTLSEIRSKIDNSLNAGQVA